MTQTIREITASDVGPALDVWLKANAARDVDSPPEHVAIVRAQLSARATIRLVCVEENGAVVGFVTGEPRVLDGDEVEGAIQLLSIFVSPDVQGGGVGSRLMEAFVAAAERRGRVEIHLWVRTANAGARRFYERYGFRAAGEQIDSDLALTSYVRSRPA